MGEEFNIPVLTAYDNIDGEVDVLVDESIDIDTPGVYVVKYIAVDEAGNESNLIIYLYVLTNEEPPSDYPEMDEENLLDLKNDWEQERASVNNKKKKSLEDYDEDIYYSSIANKTGIDLMNELTIIISDMYQVTYDDVRFVLEESDVMHSIFGPYLYGIYDGTKLIRYWDSKADSRTIDREHVWPNSYLGDEKRAQNGIASDIHNIRAILNTTNSSRSNRYFVDGPVGLSTNDTIGDHGYYPGDDHKGDVARIILYMYVRYENLQLTNNISAIINQDSYNPDSITFGLLDTLLRWHHEDPVDDFERQRNNVIYEYQGNRNPFIDNEELVSLIWEVETTDGTYILEVMFVNVDINYSDLDNEEDKRYIS